MKVTPYSEEEFKSRKLMSPAIYEFRIHESREKISKNGQEMIEIILKVSDSINGRIFTIFDYLMDTETMGFKIRHIYECVGMIEKYESGNIDAKDLLGKSGLVKVGVKKDPNKIYDDKNVALDYITVKKESIGDGFDDDISF